MYDFLGFRVGGYSQKRQADPVRPCHSWKNHLPSRKRWIIMKIRNLRKPYSLKVFYMALDCRGWSYLSTPFGNISSQYVGWPFLPRVAGLFRHPFWDESSFQIKRMFSYTFYPPCETKIAPENWWLEDFLPFGKAYFHGYVSFKKGISSKFSWLFPLAIRGISAEIAVRFEISNNRCLLLRS